MRFSTVDQDTTSTSCTVTYPGGWWFAECLDSNLNGMFGPASNSDETIFWRTINERIIKTEMKIQTYDDKGELLLRYVYTLRCVSYDSHSGVCNRVSTRK